MHRRLRPDDRATHRPLSRATEEFLRDILVDPPQHLETARTKRERLERLAGISTRHEEELRNLLQEEAEARAQRNELEWLADVSLEHERPAA